MSGSWQAERGSRWKRRLHRDDHREEVGDDVRVGVGVRVGHMEFQLYYKFASFPAKTANMVIGPLSQRSKVEV